MILVEGVGVFLTSGFCTGTTRQMFLPCTVVSNVCAYETVYKVANSHDVAACTTNSYDDCMYH